MAKIEIVDLRPDASSYCLPKGAVQRALDELAQPAQAKPAQAKPVQAKPVQAKPAQLGLISDQQLDELAMRVAAKLRPLIDAAIGEALAARALGEPYDREAARSEGAFLSFKERRKKRLLAGGPIVMH
jgi:hypothetical protein